MRIASWIKFVVAPALLVVATAAQAAPLVIDHFSTPSGGQNQTASAFGSNIMTATTAGSDIIGLNRVAQINSLQTDPVTIFVNSAGGPHSFLYSSANALGWSLVEWDGDTTLGLNPTGLGSKDLTVSGTQNALEFRVDSLDWASTAVFTVYTDANSASKYTLSIPGSTTDTSFYLPYSAFADAGLGGGSADFSDVGAIQWQFTAGTIDTDLKSDYIQTGYFVPEPSTSLLLAAGMVGMSLIRRRRS